jgi:type II secretory pathway pseudopilin PulG
MLQDNKKGQTLVEVVVALGIVFIVFASMTTLVISSIRLVVKSRDKTEAIYLAQREITEFQDGFTRSCLLTAGTACPSVFALDPGTNLYYSVCSDGANFPTGGPADANMNASNFINILVRVSGNAVGSDILYETRSFISKDLGQ